MKTIEPTAAVHGCEAPLDPQQAQVMLDLADENAMLVRLREEDRIDVEHWRVCYWKEHRAKITLVLCWALVAAFGLFVAITKCNAQISGDGGDDE